MAETRTAADLHDDHWRRCRRWAFGCGLAAIILSVPTAIYGLLVGPYLLVGGWTSLAQVPAPSGDVFEIGYEDHAPRRRPIFSPGDPDCRFYLIRHAGRRRHAYVLGGGWCALNHLPAGAHNLSSSIELRTDAGSPNRFWVVYDGQTIAALDLGAGKYWSTHGWLVDPRMSSKEQWDTLTAIGNDGSWDPWAVLPHEPFPTWATIDGGTILGVARRPPLPWEAQSDQPSR